MCSRIGNQDTDCTKADHAKLLSLDLTACKCFFRFFCIFGNIAIFFVLLYFARDVLVNSEDIVDALVGGKIGRYVTDFPTPEIAGVKHAIVIPHLGASTAESEDNCAKMAVEELKDFLENGNIRNSVNFPACDMGVRDKTRITILHRNIPNMIGQFTALLAKDNVNIDDMTNKSRGSYAYTMIDVDNDVAEDVVKGLEMIESVLKVRVIA